MSIGGHDPQRSTAENYLVFSREARGRSPAYESLAAAVAADEVILEFLGTLPLAKRQPNLLFAAARYLLDAPPYVAAQDRERFTRTVRDLADAWLSNEAPGVVPGLPFTDFRDGTFVLGRGGRTALAFTGGHGDWLQWLDG